MKFIAYKKLKEIQEAAKNGNETAKNIIDKYMSDEPDMDSIGRLMDEYYGSLGIDSLEKPEETIPEPEAVLEDAIASEEPTETEGEPSETEELPMHPEAVVDLTSELDGELDGLIDLDKAEPISFGDFLGRKRRDGLRARKNAEYFKAYDQEGRNAYLSKKKDEFANGFLGARRKNERGFNDINGSLDLYSQMVTDLPDDDNEIDVSVASKAYDDFTGSEENMAAFGRSWDESDNEAVKAALVELVGKYGKKNVIAVLNTLRDDNAAWRRHNDGRIDNAVSNYGKALDGLLK